MLEIKKSLLAVVIPAYNEEKYIEKTIKSYMEQQANCIYEIIVVDNNSTDKTYEIATEILWNKNVYKEDKKWLVHARRWWIEYIKDTFPSIEIILQADADVHPANEHFIQTHFNQYKDDNVIWVWWNIEFIDRKMHIKFFYFLENLLNWKLGKSYFWKRQFYIDKWIMPVSWWNMSYRIDSTDNIKVQVWSALAEDFYLMSNILIEEQKRNKYAVVRLLDESNAWDDAKIFASSRDDSLYRIIQNRSVNLEDLIKTWINSSLFTLNTKR